MTRPCFPSNDRGLGEIGTGLKTRDVSVRLSGRILPNSKTWQLAGVKRHADALQSMGIFEDDLCFVIFVGSQFKEIDDFSEAGLLSLIVAPSVDRVCGFVVARNERTHRSQQLGPGIQQWGTIIHVIQDLRFGRAVRQVFDPIANPKSSLARLGLDGRMESQFQEVKSCFVHDAVNRNLTGASIDRHRQVVRWAIGNSAMEGKTSGHLAR